MEEWGKIGILSVVLESYREYIKLVQRQQGGTETGVRTVRFTAGKMASDF